MRKCRINLPDAALCAKLMQIAEDEGVAEMEGLAALLHRVGQADKSFHRMLEKLAELVVDVGVTGPGSARQALWVLEDFNTLRAAGEEWSQPMDVLGDHAPIEQLLALARARARRGEGNLAAMIRKLERLPTEGS